MVQAELPHLSSKPGPQEGGGAAPLHCGVKGRQPDLRDVTMDD